MSQKKTLGIKRSVVAETTYRESAQFNIDYLIEMLDLLQLAELLEYLAKSNQNLLFTLEQTSRFLNIEYSSVDALARSGKLAQTGSGKFRTSDVYNYYLDIIKRREQGLKRMAKIENSVRNPIGNHCHATEPVSLSISLGLECPMKMSGLLQKISHPYQSTFHRTLT